MSRYVGYARVSTLEQNLELQLTALKSAGCDSIFQDKISGTTIKRPGLDEALAALQPGDTLVVWRLDRLGRGTVHLIETVEALMARGVFFRSLNDAVYYDGTPGSVFTFTLFAALAKLERDVISERTRAGVANARAQGRIGGRRKMTAVHPRVVKAMELREKEVGVKDIALTLGVQRDSVYRYLRIGRKALEEASRQGGNS